MSLQCAYPFVLFILFPILFVVVLYRYMWYQGPLYHHALTSIIERSGYTSAAWWKKGLFFLRLFILIILIVFIARPQWVDRSSRVRGEGRDIILALDLSGSMHVFDDMRDRRSRIEVAKTEAIKFVDARVDDPIGIVLFAKEALSRVPVTLDKTLLNEALAGLELGFIDPDGTSLGTGLATAVNRLKKSQSKSKIIILLTDGEPTPQTDKIAPDVATNLAREYGIKVYTIGIGSKQGGFVHHPFFGVQRVGARLDMQLLNRIARDTGGKSFRAYNPADMKRIYQEIDALEKTEYETNIFQNVYEVFFPWILILVLCLMCEFFLKVTVLKGIV